MRQFTRIDAPICGKSWPIAGSNPGRGPHVDAIDSHSPRRIVMKEQAAAAAGRFAVGGDIEVNRLGFGAMRVTGAGVWGQPADRAEALRTLRRLPDLGVDFID